MMRLIFMRHGYLEGRYKDYSRLHFDEIEDLLTKRVSPGIDKERTKAALKTKRFLPELDLIICSEERRGIETARLVRDLSDADLEASSLLNEVRFTQGIIDNTDIVDFNRLRVKVLTQFYASRCSENFEDAKRRFLHFLEHTKKLKHDAILCITHGWFMRLISIYSVKGSLEGVTLRDMLDTKISGFLDTVEIEIQRKQRSGGYAPKAPAPPAPPPAAAGPASCWRTGGRASGAGAAWLPW